MPPASDSLQESVVFLLGLAMVILILRVVSLQLLPRALRWVYNSIQTVASKGRTRRRYESLARRFPRLAGWLRRRLSVRHFAGLPLTLLAAGALYTVALASSRSPGNVRSSSPRW